MEHTDNKFFKYVWRFNALVIAGVAVLCILFGGIGAIKLFTNVTRERPVTDIINVDSQTKIEDEFSLGGLERVAGSEYVMIPLYREQSYDMPYYSKNSRSNKINYLFLNVSSNESRWLLQGTNQLFLSSLALLDRLEKSPNDTGKSVGILYSLVERDSDGDGRLTTQDLITLSISDANGGNFKKLIEGIERLYSSQQIADDKFLIIYQKNKETISELYSIPTMKQLSQQKIPQVRLN